MLNMYVCFEIVIKTSVYKNYMCNWVVYKHFGFYLSMIISENKWLKQLGEYKSLGSVVNFNLL